jgi:hypothetical protein
MQVPKKKEFTDDPFKYAEAFELMAVEPDATSSDHPWCQRVWRFLAYAVVNGVCVPETAEGGRPAKG